MNAEEQSASLCEAPDNAEQFADWVRPHLRPLANLVARLAPTSDRDDVVQETLIRAWVKRKLYDPSRGTAAAWLLAIGADQAAKARRRARLGVPLPAPTLPVASEPGVDPDLSLALSSLSKRQRLVVECVYFVGLSVRETASVMHCAEGTVKSTLSDARARLRTLLKVTG